MSIRTGIAAAPFALPVRPGETVDVGAAMQKGSVVLLFFPLAFSSVCTKEMCAVRDSWSAWQQLDAAVFGITADSPFVTDKFAQELELPFPVLSDYNRDVARQYGVLYEEEFFGMRDVPKRAAFVIRDGAVVYDWVSDDAGKMPDLDAVRQALA